MIVLAIDTATRDGSLAVARDTAVLAARRGDGTRPHGTRLPGDALDALAAAGCTLADVTLFGVCLGPGGFTGLRVGIAATQGLAFATGRPVVGVSALEALAVAALEDTGDGTVAGVWMDAARGEVFAARFRRAALERTGVTPVEDAMAAAPAAVAERWRQDRPAVTRWIGDGTSRYAGHLPADATPLPTPLLAPLVARLARLRAAEAEPPHALRPIYVRPPDAEMARHR